MKRLKIFIVLAFTVMSLYAQPNISQISIRYGVVENFQDSQLYKDIDKTVSFPEISIGGDLSKHYLSWSFYWGHWNDGITQVLPVMDMITWSASANILGLRIILSSDLFDFYSPVSFDIYTGLAHHFISHEYIGGAGVDGRPGEDYNSSINTAELGLTVGIKVVQRFKIFADIERFFIISSDNLTRDTGKNAYKIGLTYFFSI